MTYWTEKNKNTKWTLIDSAKHFKTGKDFAVLTNCEGDTIIVPWDVFMKDFFYWQVD